MNKLILIILILGSNFLTAQENLENNPIERKGFIFGTSVGGGLYHVNGDTYSRLSLPNIKIGSMVNEKLGILLYAPSGIHKLNGATEERAFEALTLTAQYWISDKFYLNTGAGMAIETTPIYLVDFTEGPPEFNTGIGITASAGYEVLQWSKNKTIDVQLRFLYGNIHIQDSPHKDHLAIDLMIGFNLY